MTLYSLDQAKAANQSLGHHWFDRDAMRYFGTRLSLKVYPVPNGLLFTASHQPPSSSRLYCVHFTRDTGETESVGDVLDGTASSASAHRRAKRLSEVWHHDSYPALLRINTGAGIKLEEVVRLTNHGNGISRVFYLRGNYSGRRWGEIVDMSSSLLEVSRPRARLT